MKRPRALAPDPATTGPAWPPPETGEADKPRPTPELLLQQGNERIRTSEKAHARVRQSINDIHETMDRSRRLIDQSMQVIRSVPVHPIAAVRDES